MKISVVGCGNPGPVHTASTAEPDHDVIGIDLDCAEIGMLSQAEAAFVEPALEELRARTLGTGRLAFAAW